MSLQLPPELTGILATAFTAGAETTVEEFALALGWSDGAALDAAADVLRLVDELGLEFVPALTTGEFRSTRVLRRSEREAGGAELVQPLMLAGEGQQVEYKSSLISSMHHWNKEGLLTELQSLPGEVLKTICAFLNSEGGELLIGVDDDGVPCPGIQCDLDLKGWKIDKWQLHLMTLINERFLLGSQVLPYIQLRVTAIEATYIAHVSVMARKERSFVRREKGAPLEFFTRTGPRTDSLDLPTFYEHLVARLEH